MKTETMSTVTRLIRRLALIKDISLHLGVDAASKRRLLLGGLRLFLNDARKSNSGFTATLVKAGKQFSFTFEDFADYFTLSEVFLNDEYEAPVGDPEVILDLGSNVGFSLMYFRIRYPEARLYGFEPDPNTFRRLRDGVGQLPGVHVYPYAIASFDGEIPFHTDPHRNQSSSLERRSDRQQRVLVQARKLDTLLSELGLQRVDLLKFDIEGAEMDVFSHFERRNVVQTYIGEVHEDGADWTRADFMALFADAYHIEAKALGQRREQIIARRKEGLAGR